MPGKRFVRAARRRWRPLGWRLRCAAYLLSALPFAALLVLRLWAGLPATQAVLKAVADAFGGGVNLLLSTWWGLVVAGWALRFVRRDQRDCELTWELKNKTFTLRSADSVRVFELARVAQATMYELEKEPAYSRVKIALRDGGELELEMPTDDAEAFIRSTRLGPRDRAYRLQALRVGFGAIGLLGYLLLIPAALLGCLGASLGLISADYWLGTAATSGSGGTFLMVVLALLVIGSVWDSLRWLIERVAGHQVELGNDGIRWGGVWSSRFLPYGDIKNIHYAGYEDKVVQSWLVIEDKTGHSFRIGLRGVGQGSKRIVEARLRGVLEQEADLLVPVIAKRDRSDARWRADLRELLRGDGSYRQERIPRAKVQELLHDPMAPADQRLGAAIALLEAREPSLHDTLLRICEGTANPTLKRRFAMLADEAVAVAGSGGGAEATQAAASAARR